MKISEIEKQLEVMREEHGDIDVAVYDNDTGWLLGINPADLAISQDGKRVEIGAEYSNKIDV